MLQKATWAPPIMKSLLGHCRRRAVRCATPGPCGLTRPVSPGTVAGCADHLIPLPGQPGVKVDARSERWREHRKKVRAEIVEAAFRAIDRLGPNVSVREIAEEAGTAKPKIYRHFTDKSDMFAQIGERMRDMLWAAVIPSIDIESDSARQVIGRAVEHYVELVDQHPNVVRFLLQGRFADQSAAAMTTVNRGRDITLAIAEMVSGELKEMELDPAVFELAAFASVRHRGLGHRLVARRQRRQPAPDARRGVRRAHDDDHDGCGERHGRAGRRADRPRPAHSQCGPASGIRAATRRLRRSGTPAPPGALTRVIGYRDTEKYPVPAFPGKALTLCLLTLSRPAH